MPSKIDVFPKGTVVDRNIELAAENGELIIENFLKRGVKQACYELRAGQVFYETLKDERDRKKVISVDGYFILKPRGLVTVIVQEKIRLPSNVMARILTKGQLFSVGIMPVNTYADPGFEGKLGIVLHNTSNRYIKIAPGEPVAKIEFSILEEDVQRPYAGQHGYETQIWPIKTEMFLDEGELRSKKLIGSVHDELAEIYGPEIGRISRGLAYYSSMIWLQIGITSVFLVTLLLLNGKLGVVESVSSGILGNLATTLCINAWGRVTGRL